MLNILGLSLVGALICTIVTGGVGAIARRNWDDICERLGFTIVSFAIEFIWMGGFLYCSCKPLTLITVLMWMWPTLIANAIISAMFFYDSSEIYDYACHIILAVLSGIVCLASTFGIVQNLIYTHDMSNTDVTYAVTSDEILAKVELTIDNSDWRERYTVDSPEMRNVNGEDYGLIILNLMDGTSEKYPVAENQIPDWVDFTTTYPR